MLFPNGVKFPRDKAFEIFVSRNSALTEYSSLIINRL